MSRWIADSWEIKFEKNITITTYETISTYIVDDDELIACWADEMRNLWLLCRSFRSKNTISSETRFYRLQINNSKWQQQNFYRSISTKEKPQKD